MDNVYIIATTSNNAGRSVLANYHQTQVVVDESAQSTEASTLVFIGDEKQLQSTVTCRAYNEFYPQMFMSLF